MTDRDPRCVLAAEDNATARIVATWLTEEGFPAKVVDEQPLGGFDGMTAILPGGLEGHGLEVWVQDAAQADAARGHVQTWLAELEAKRQKRESRTGDLIVTCEDCGKQLVFAASQAGNVEVCPHCGGYVDVLDPDEEHIDVGEAEGDEADE